MRHDLFIHSNCPLETDSAGSIIPSILRYTASIKAAVLKSQSPICVSGAASVYGIPEARTIYTVGSNEEVTGEITKDQADKLLRILGKIDYFDEFRIHGTYLGYCIAEFAVQLYGLIYCNEYWPHYPRTLGKDIYNELRGVHSNRVRSLLTSKRFYDSRIRYGVVLQKKPYGNIVTNKPTDELTKQLSDDETQIYRANQMINTSQF